MKKYLRREKEISKEKELVNKEIYAIYEK